MASTCGYSGSAFSRRTAGTGRVTKGERPGGGRGGSHVVGSGGLVTTATAGVAIQLFPLSAFRAANKAAENVYQAVRRDGHQRNVVETMQTREELYDRIGYHAFEQQLDALFAAKK